MSQKAISELSSVTNLNDNDYILVSQNCGEVLRSVKTNVNIFKDFLRGSFLPLAGNETITGPVYLGGTATIAKNVDNSTLTIHGGARGEDDARLDLNGKDTDKSGGQFGLYAAGKVLTGTKEGVLKWDGKNIVRSISLNNSPSYADDNGSINLEFGNYLPLSGNATVTGPVNFSNSLKCRDKNLATTITVNGSTINANEFGDLSIGDYFPISGNRVITGPVYLGGTATIAKNVKNSTLTIHGCSSLSNDAKLTLNGSETGESAGGQFGLYAVDKVLTGTKDGTLKWDGKNIVRSIGFHGDTYRDIYASTDGRLNVYIDADLNNLTDLENHIPSSKCLREAAEQVIKDVNVYISPSGSDTEGKGTFAQPFFTLTKASQHLSLYRSNASGLKYNIRCTKGTYNYNAIQRIRHPDCNIDSGNYIVVHGSGCIFDFGNYINDSNNKNNESYVINVNCTASLNNFTIQSSIKKKYIDSDGKWVIENDSYNCNQGLFIKDSKTGNNIPQLIGGVHFNGGRIDINGITLDNFNRALYNSGRGIMYLDSPTFKNCYECLIANTANENYIHGISKSTSKPNGNEVTFTDCAYGFTISSNATFTIGLTDKNGYIKINANFKTFFVAFSQGGRYRFSGFFSTTTKEEAIDACITADIKTENTNYLNEKCIIHDAYTPDTNIKPAYDLLKDKFFATMKTS